MAQFEFSRSEIDAIHRALRVYDRQLSNTGPVPNSVKETQRQRAHVVKVILKRLEDTGALIPEGT